MEQLICFFIRYSSFSIRRSTLWVVSCHQETILNMKSMKTTPQKNPHENQVSLPESVLLLCETTGYSLRQIPENQLVRHRWWPKFSARSLRDRWSVGGRRLWWPPLHAMNSLTPTPLGTLSSRAPVVCPLTARCSVMSSPLPSCAFPCDCTVTALTQNHERLLANAVVCSCARRKLTDPFDRGELRAI